MRRPRPPQALPQRRRRPFSPFPSGPSLGGLGRPRTWLWLAAGGILLATGLALREPRQAEALPEETPLALAPPSATRPVDPVAKAGPSPVLPPPGPPTRDRALASPPEPAATAAAPQRWVEATVQPGDSLSAIFRRLGLNDRQLLTLLEADRKLARRLHRILPGQRIEVLKGPEGRLLGLRYHPDPLHVVEARRVGDGYRVQERDRPVERRQAFATGQIRDSLFLSAQRAGLSERLTMELAGIFGWDIDFLRDIREGDRFTVLYEELYLDGEKLKDGPILAAEFVNRGRRYRAVRYTGPDGRTGYYTPEGRSLRRAFLRTPVAFTRISSRFSLGRYHPILHRIRAHRGVDYAAPRGTPVKAAGDGKVVFRGWKGGYGRAVILQHGTRYTTLYGHLARFARGLRKGSRVRQGQVIGYVGSSGLATGPHLHYEFRVDGRHKDPLKVRLPPARPIHPRYRADFLARTRPLLARLERIAATRLAAAGREP